MRTEPLARSVWARSRWLIVAPHADDETLGAGALLRHAATAGRLGGVVYLTDGTGSHPAGTPGIAVARRREARLAVHRLCRRATPIVRLGWRDAHPHDRNGPTFEREARRLGALMRLCRIDAVAVSGGEDAHCDHVAAYRLVQAAIRRARRAIALFSYHVWSEPPRGRGIATPPMPQGLRRQALRAHRSQLTPAYGDGFRLPLDRLAMPARDRLILRRG